MGLDSGFVEEMREREVKLYQGEWIDQIWMAMMEEEWFGREQKI